MTHLELVTEIGSEPMEIVKLHLKGLLSFGELEDILGRDKASLVHTFATDSGAGRIGELLLPGLKGYMVQSKKRDQKKEARGKKSEEANCGE